MEERYKTFFDKGTGAYLGSYNGPDESNPYLGHPYIDGQVDAFHKLVDGQPVREVPEPSYREKRKQAYIMELGSTPGDFAETVGDVIDDLIREVRALTAQPDTQEFADLVSKVDAIKERFPKPSG